MKVDIVQGVRYIVIESGEQAPALQFGPSLNGNPVVFEEQLPYFGGPEQAVFNSIIAMKLGADWFPLPD